MLSIQAINNSKERDYFSQQRTNISFCICDYIMSCTAADIFPSTHTPDVHLGGWNLSCSACLHLLLTVIFQITLCSLFHPKAQSLPATSSQLTSFYSWSHRFPVLASFLHILVFFSNSALSPCCKTWLHTLPLSWQASIPSKIPWGVWKTITDTFPCTTMYMESQSSPVDASPKNMRRWVF